MSIPFVFWDGGTPEHEITVLHKAGSRIFSGSVSGEICCWIQQNASSAQQAEDSTPLDPVALLVQDDSTCTTCMASARVGARDFLFTANTSGVISVWDASGGVCLSSELLLSFAATRMHCFRLGNTTYLLCAGANQHMLIFLVVPSARLQLVAVIQAASVVVDVVLAPFNMPVSALRSPTENKNQAPKNTGARARASVPVLAADAGSEVEAVRAADLMVWAVSERGTLQIWDLSGISAPVINSRPGTRAGVSTKLDPTGDLFSSIINTVAGPSGSSLALPPRRQTQQLPAYFSAGIGQTGSEATGLSVAADGRRFAVCMRHHVMVCRTETLRAELIMGSDSEEARRPVEGWAGCRFAGSASDRLLLWTPGAKLLALYQLPFKDGSGGGAGNAVPLRPFLAAFVRPDTSVVSHPPPPRPLLVQDNEVFVGLGARAAIAVFKLPALSLQPALIQSPNQQHSRPPPALVQQGIYSLQDAFECLQQAATQDHLEQPDRCTASTLLCDVRTSPTSPSLPTSSQSLPPRNAPSSPGQPPILLAARGYQSGAVRIVPLVPGLGSWGPGGRLLRGGHRAAVVAMAGAARGQTTVGSCLLLSGGRDGSVVVWEVDVEAGDAAPIEYFNLSCGVADIVWPTRSQRPGSVSGVSFKSTADVGSSMIFSTEAGSTACSAFPCLGMAVNQPSCDLVFVMGVDHTVWIWSVANRAMVQIYRDSIAVASGHVLLLTQAWRLYVWNISNGCLVRIVEGQGPDSPQAFLQSRNLPFPPHVMCAPAVPGVTVTAALPAVLPIKRVQHCKFKNMKRRELLTQQRKAAVASFNALLEGPHTPAQPVKLNQKPSPTQPPTDPARSASSQAGKSPAAGAASDSRGGLPLMQPLGTSRWRLRKEGLRCVGLQVNFSTMLLGYQRHISQLELSETESKKVDNTSNPSKVLYPWLISLLFDFDRSLGQELHDMLIGGLQLPTPTLQRGFAGLSQIRTGDRGTPKLDATGSVTQHPATEHLNCYSLLLPSFCKRLGRWRFGGNMTARQALALSTVCMNLLAKGAPGDQVLYSRIVAHYNVIVPGSFPGYQEASLSHLVSVAVSSKSDEESTVSVLLMQGVVERMSSSQRLALAKRWSAFYNYPLPELKSSEQNSMAQLQLLLGPLAGSAADSTSSFSSSSSQAKDPTKKKLSPKQARKAAKRRAEASASRLKLVTKEEMMTCMVLCQIAV